jgi:mevalonate kinase
MSYSSSAPGSLMLFGEHAVLHGMQALCCAVDQRIHVMLTPRQDRNIYLSSTHLGQCKLSLDNLTIRAPFKFVLTAIERYRSQLPSGFDLNIHSEFSSSLGLGSSSAVTVATLGVLMQWLELSISPFELFSAAKEVIVAVQGIGSGADVAAAVFGGVVAYRMQPVEIKTFASTPNIVLVYSGAKVPTRTVIQYVSQQQQADPERYQQLFNAIDVCATAAITALQEQNWQTFGELMNQHQTLQQALGVSTPLLDELITHLRQQPQILGAKISGSGLGDCVIGLGTLAENFFPVTPKQHKAGVKQIPVNISTTGYQHEKA